MPKELPKAMPMPQWQNITDPAARRVVEQMSRQIDQLVKGLYAKIKDLEARLTAGGL